MMRTRFGIDPHVREGRARALSSVVGGDALEEEEIVLAARLSFPSALPLPPSVAQTKDH